MAISIYNPYEFSFVLRLLNGNSGVAFSQTGTSIVAFFFVYIASNLFKTENALVYKHV